MATNIESYFVRDRQGVQALYHNALVQSTEGYAVLDGCRIARAGGSLGQSDTLVCYSGTALFNGEYMDVPNQDVPLPDSDDNPRWDLVYLDENADVGVVSGTPAPPEPDSAMRTDTKRPAPPDLKQDPADGTDFDRVVPLAIVWVGGGAQSVTSSDIVTVRMSADVIGGAGSFKSLSVEDQPTELNDVIRQADFNGHLSDDNNPHDVTAQDANAVPSDGGDMDGSLRHTHTAPYHYYDNYRIAPPDATSRFVVLLHAYDEASDATNSTTDAHAIGTITGVQSDSGSNHGVSVTMSPTTGTNAAGEHYGVLHSQQLGGEAQAIDPRLVTCTYEGEEYLAVDYPTSTGSHAPDELLTFTGYANPGSASEHLTVVEYYDAASDTILDSDVYPSLEPFESDEPSVKRVDVDEVVYSGDVTISGEVNGIDVGEHANREDNPHNVTAEQADALPAEGGEVDGAVTITGETTVGSLNFGAESDTGGTILNVGQITAAEDVDNATVTTPDGGALVLVDGASERDIMRVRSNGGRVSVTRDVEVTGDFEAGVVTAEDYVQFPLRDTNPTNPPEGASWLIAPDSDEAV